MERREFLKLGGLIIGFGAGLTREAEAAGEFSPNGYVRVGHGGDVTVLLENADIGQGSWTGLAMLVAEELGADWNSVRIIQAPADPKVYKHLSTGGSGATINGWEYLRQAGAQGREMLITAAANRWQVSRESCRAEDGHVKHTASGRNLGYGELVEDAAKLTPPDATKVALKDPKDYRLIGHSMPRRDVPSKVDGSAQYGMDVRIPGMLYAVVARCPTFGGKPAKYDREAAKRVAGVRQVFEIPAIGRVANTAGGVAVVADNTWAAIEGRKALAVTWDRGRNAGESSETLRELGQKQLKGPATYVHQERGNVEQGLAKAAKVVEAVYELPFQPHATMEPMNCTADVRADRIDIWAGTQCARAIKEQVASYSGLAAEAVTIHNQWAGGGFGRRYQWDYPTEAWQVSKAAGKPVKLVWTREDDMQHDFYRPLSYHRLRAALGPDGKPTAWTHRIVSTSIREVFDPPEKLDPKGVARQEVDGSDVLYSVPALRIDFAPLKSCVPRAWWRSVSASFNGFAIESFIDELAHAAGRDPLEYRLDLLRAQGEDAAVIGRVRKILEVVAEKSGWGKPAPAGCARGIAAVYSFGSVIGYVATVSKDPNGAIRVRQVTGAVDCGTAVNPDAVKMMVEGGAIFGLSATLQGEVTVANGAIVQTNFDGFRAVRMPEAPAMEVHVVNSGAEVGGMGEAGVPPIAPAVANAVFALTGERRRKLPLG
jgi:isoquinoline 1-oxidoreductase subunit beta